MGIRTKEILQKGRWGERKTRDCQRKPGGGGGGGGGERHRKKKHSRGKVKTKTVIETATGKDHQPGFQNTLKVETVAARNIKIRHLRKKHIIPKSEGGKKGQIGPRRVAQTTGALDNRLPEKKRMKQKEKREQRPKCQIDRPMGQKTQGFSKGKGNLI